MRETLKRIHESKNVAGLVVKKLFSKIKKIYFFFLVGGEF